MKKIEGKLEATEDEKQLAIYSFSYSFAVAKIKAVFKRSLRRARARIAARKGSSSKSGS